MLKYRLITGPILIILLLAMVAIDDRLDRATDIPRGILLYALALIGGALAAWELTMIYRAQGIRAHVWLTVIATISGLSLMYILPMPDRAHLGLPLFATGFAAILVTSLLTFCRGQNVQGVVAATGAVLHAMVYVGVLMGFFFLIRANHSAWWIVGIILTTKMCDTGAYFTGRAIGKHKLIVWLSPGKTWEGLAGGVITSGIVGLIFAALSQRYLAPTDHVSLFAGAVWGVIFGLVGQFGDLMKSLLKRGAGIKDSSAMLPGLGGVLDVIDSPIMVAPVAFWLIWLGWP